MRTGWESDDLGARAHDELVERLTAEVNLDTRLEADERGLYRLALVARCDGKSGRCREAVAWVGRTSNDGLLAEYRTPSAVGERDATVEAWLESDVFAGRRPTGLGFDLLEYPGAERRPPIEVSCPEGHGPSTLDRGRLVGAARAATAEVPIPKVRSATD